MSWRETGRQARLMGLDARTLFTIILVVLWPNSFTVTLCLLTFILFYGIERFGMTFSMAFRRFRKMIAGPRTFSRPEWKTDRSNFGQ